MNPYQHIIDWLRTREGELWSHRRNTQAARRNDSSTCVDMFHRGTGECYLIGVFSVKLDYMRIHYPHRENDPA